MRFVSPVVRHVNTLTTVGMLLCVAGWQQRCGFRGGTVSWKHSTLDHRPLSRREAPYQGLKFHQQQSAMEGPAWRGTACCWGLGPCGVEHLHWQFCDVQWGCYLCQVASLKLVATVVEGNSGEPMGSQVPCTGYLSQLLMLHDAPVSLPMSTAHRVHIDAHVCCITYVQHVALVLPTRTSCGTLTVCLMMCCWLSHCSWCPWRGRMCGGRCPDHHTQLQPHQQQCTFWRWRRAV